MVTSFGLYLVAYLWGCYGGFLVFWPLLASSEYLGGVRVSLWVIFSFFPFGKEAISRDELTNEMDIGTSPLGVIGNVLWFVFAGLWLAIGHVLSAAACFVTIIGIPFALQHLKLAVISLAPIGKTVVSSEEAAMARYNINR